MAETPASGARTPASPPELDPIPVCHVCASPFIYVSLSPCLHTTCHICALRLRALYKSMDCTVCKQPQPRLLLLTPESMPSNMNVTTTEEREELFDDMLGKCPFSDEALSIHFEDLPMKEASLQLLRFNCPYSRMHLLTDPDEPLPAGAPKGGCPFVARRGGFPELQQHVRKAHGGREMCDLCIRSKKIFAHEHVLYTPKQLAMHLPSLPRPPDGPKRAPGARVRRRGPQQELESESEEEPEEEVKVEWSHPMCAFCRDCFAADDDLFAHLREAHEECFLCRRAGLRDVYFQNYNALSRHFSSEHHPCPHPTCVQQHFVVFASVLDLKAHYVQTHGSELSRRELADMGRIEGVFESASAGGSGGGGGGRRRRFGAQLTSEGEAEQAAPTGVPATPASREALDTLQRQTLTDEQAEALRALLRTLPPLQPTQHLSLRASLLSWLSHQSSGRDLIHILSSLLGPGNSSNEHVSRAISSLCNHGGLPEDRETELRTDLNAWKAEQAQAFPTLVGGDSADFAAIASGRGIPGPSEPSSRPQPAPPPAPSTRGGRGGRPAPRTVWDRVERAAANTAPSAPVVRAPAPRTIAPSDLSFPALSSAARPVPGAARSAGVRSTAWSAAASGSSSAVSSMRPSPVQSPAPRPQPKPKARAPPPPSAASFPGLPSRPVERIPLGGAGGNSSYRNIIGAAEPRASSWARPQAAASAPPPPTPAVEGEPSEPGSPTEDGTASNGNTGGGGKKKKRVKETLFTLGSFPTS